MTIFSDIYLNMAQPIIIIMQLWNNGMYEINNILNVKHKENAKFKIIDLEYGNLFINKETLEHSVNNNITARCELKQKNQKSFFRYAK